KRVTRTYIARDESGNESAPCTINLLLERIDFSMIDFPDSLTVADGDALQCDVPFADRNNDGIPDPEDDLPRLGTGVPMIDGEPIYPDFMGFCNALTTFEDIVLPQIGCVQKIMRMWTVREWHCTGERDTLYIQLIEIVDDEGPEITCPPSFTNTTTGHFCTATVLLPPALVDDACSDIVTVTVAYPGGFSPTNGGVFVSLPVGVNVITYTAYDECYNSSSCTMTIKVVDLTPPIPICDEHTIVSLTLGGPDGLTKVDASVFDDGSYDACGPVTFKAARMDYCIDFDWTTEGAGVDEIPNGLINSRDRGTVLRTKVPFSCCDAGAGPIMILLEVTDASGNTNSCMVEVEVQDKIPPIISCPDDITISCEFPLDLDNLDVFGGVVQNDEEQQEFCVYDPTNPNADNQGFVCGLGGLVIDNCGVDISVTEFVDINQCGVGVIIRTFIATDANGSRSCQQRIFIEDFDPIDGDSIDWPDHYIGVECSEGTDPDDLPYPYDRPRLDDDECSMVAMSFEDLIFEFADGACFKILRTWTVIDWCLFEELGGIVIGENYWQYTQIIKVMNQFGPEFTTTQPTIELCNNFDCGGLFVELIQRAEDDCTADELLQWSYAVDLDNDGFIDIGPIGGFGPVINASGIYPLGTHRIIYSFEDRCGNRTVAEQILNLLSCKAPVPVCINGLSTDLMAVDTDGDGDEDTGMITIWATDFDASSYHPCGFYFTLSLSPDTSVKSRTFDCSHVGLGQVPVNLYVTDLLGNQAWCETYIIIQDNMGICPDTFGLTGTITGNVSTETTDNVLDVAVQLGGTTLVPINTNQTGTYTFPSMPVGGNYEVKPSKNNDYKNGVSTLDLVNIQKHLLGIKSLESPYKMIAADANDSKSITAIDLIELRKLILGIYSELPNNSSWRFVDKEYVFPDPYNPWMQVWPESHTLNPLSFGITHADFFGIKVGDVNNTVKANAQSITPRGSGDNLNLVIDDVKVEIGTSVEIPVYAGGAYSLEGMQFSLDFDHSLALKNVIAGQMDVTNENFAFLNNKTLTSSWNTAEAVEINDAQPLFTLVMQVSKSVRLSEVVSIAVAPTQPEAYSLNNEILDLNLSFRGADNSISFELLQNEPNPFSTQTTIGFILPGNGQATLTVFDLAGRKLFDQPVAGLKGLNKVEISRSQLGAQGMVYYQVQFEGYTATKKMLIL
ncbi:MAG: HYR domain-containing protein, partial [Saprospiraceae bacterium]